MTAVDSAFGIADEAVQAARETFHIGDLEIGVGASAGVAFGADIDDGWEILMARADDMVYKARARGCGRRAMQEPV